MTTHASQTLNKINEENNENNENNLDNENNKNNENIDDISKDNFDDMELKDNLLRGIYAFGYEKPSVIQKRGIWVVILT